MFYKVLVNGKSCNGGNLEWSLPTEAEPGAWHTHEGNLSMCSAGLHVTDKPSRWYKKDAEVYEAECEELGSTNPHENKSVFRKVRLLRKLQDDDLTKLDIIKKTETTTVAQTLAVEDSIINSYYGFIRAHGMSVIKAYHSFVKAFDDTTVLVYGDSKVELYDNSKAIIVDTNSQVNAWGHSIVNLTNGKSLKQYEIDTLSLLAKDRNLIRASFNKLPKIGVRMFDASEYRYVPEIAAVENVIYL